MSFLREHFFNSDFENAFSERAIFKESNEEYFFLDTYFITL